MKIAGFSAEADLIGRRVRVRWEFVPGPGEAVTDIPHVELRRKLRDFEFPTVQPPHADPFVAYRSQDFPPDDATVTELPAWETEEDGLTVRWSALSLSRVHPEVGREVEFFRRTIGVVYDERGAPLRQRVELLDQGGAPGALAPGSVYYYQLSGPDLADDPAACRATVQVGEAHGHNRWLYERLPEIYRRHDVHGRPEAPGTASVPEMAPRSGQLRRFIDLFGTGLDVLRSSAEGLLGLRDLDHVDHRLLPLLARWIGWDLSHDVDIPLQRNELKSASLLYRGVGTLPGLRAIVSHYTGWFSQIAEFSQHILRAGDAPQLNLFWDVAEPGGGWCGADDVATVLGFDAEHRSASAADNARAELVGAAVEPFALRPGAELTLSADAGLPVTVRFMPGDFADIRRATAYEVAAALNHALFEVTASAVDGRLHLTSNARGAESSLRIEPAPASLLSLEAAPGGRLSLLTTSGGAARLFYEASLPLPQRAPGDPPTRSRQLRYKTFTGERWQGALAVEPTRGRPAGAPAAVELDDGRCLLAYVEEPDTAASRLRAVLGVAAPPQPARLLGLRREPFALQPGGVLTLSLGEGAPERFEVHADDFKRLDRARAVEVAQAINAQLTRVRAVPTADGALALETVRGGPDVRLLVDLQHSTTARALGFDTRNGHAAGTWSEAYTWAAPLAGPRTTARVADTFVTRERSGAARLFFAGHEGGRWRIYGSRWDGRVWAATDQGLFERPLAGGAWQAHLAALPSTDLRSLVCTEDGGLLVATDKGIAVRGPAGPWSTLTTAHGLPSDDVRALALGPDGALYAATAKGLARRAPADAFKKLPLASDDVRGVVVSPQGDVHAIIPTALVAVHPTWTEHIAQLARPPASLSHDVDGRLVVVDAGASPQRTRYDLAGAVLERVAVAPGKEVLCACDLPDGAVLLGTPAGVLGPGGAVELAGRSVRGLHGPWSPVRELAGGGGGNREPCAVVDGHDTLWLFFSQRQGVGTPEDLWRVRVRRCTDAGWQPEATPYALPQDDAGSDREPAALVLPDDAGLRVFFRSNRAGGQAIAAFDLPLDGTPADTLMARIDDPAGDHAPAPLLLGGRVHLVYRSDRSVALAQAAALAGDRSGKLPDAGALRRHAGSTSVVLRDLPRARKHGLGGDLWAYTPNRPDGAKLLEHEYYTPHTIGLYLSRGRHGSPLTPEEIDRLRQLLQGMIPLHLRHVLIVLAGSDDEVVYGKGSDPPSQIGERWGDVHPFADTYGGAADATAVHLVGWQVLRANHPDSLAADPTRPDTLRRRTFYPKPS